MGYKEVYQLWKDYPELNADLRAELETMTDEGEIEDRFYQDLEFGTGGMRGKIGAGINRMNVYIVAKATYGLGKYLLGQTQNAERVWPSPLTPEINRLNSHRPPRVCWRPWAFRPTCLKA